MMEHALPQEVRGRVTKAALVIMLGNVTSRLLGVVREQVIAALFGASGLADAFVAASTVPTVIYDLLIGGAVSAALIPIFSDYGEDEGDERELWRLASIVISLAVVVLGVAILVMEGLAGQLVWFLGRGFEKSTREQTILLVRIMLPATLFMGLSGITTALLYSRQSFTLPAFCIATYNASIIAMALALAGRLGVTSLVVGVLVGAFLQLAIQLPGLRRMTFTPSLNFAHPGLRRIVGLYLPVAAGLLVSACGVFIDRNLASRTGEGNMASMRFATALIQFPLGLIATALSYALLPTLSRYATVALDVSPVKEDIEFAELEGYKSTLVLGIKLAILAILPATVVLVVLRMPIVALLYQRGEFVAYDTWRTARAFLFYSPQLPFAAVDQLLIVAFYARKDTTTPVLVGVLGLLIYLVTALSLLQAMGMPGLALANAVQNSSHAIVLFLLLWRALGGLAGGGLGKVLTKAIIASLAMGAGCLVVASRWGMENELMLLAGAGGVGLLIYVGMLFLLRVEEMRLVWRGICDRWVRVGFGAGAGER